MIAHPVSSDSHKKSGYKVIGNHFLILLDLSVFCKLAWDLIVDAFHVPIHLRKFLVS